MKFYRYEVEQHSTYGYDMNGNLVSSKLPPITNLRLKEYVLYKETPKGYWIKLEAHSINFWKKWILKKSKKRYAYPTKEEALNNFIIRTEKRINYLKRDLDACEYALILAKNERI